MYINNDDVYKILKNIAQIVLPALGTLYFSLSQIWGLPYGEEIVGTITAVDTFLGAILKICSNNYKKESVNRLGEEFQKWQQEK